MRVLFKILCIFVKWSKPFFLYVGEDSFNGGLIVWYILTIQHNDRSVRNLTVSNMVQVVNEWPLLMMMSMWAP